MGASELLRSLGLFVDGPGRWGQQVAARSPGVFIVELVVPTDAAPIDGIAIRRWLEHVPGLLLDGERPTAADLSRRLHQFWLPGEPILFVGRSAKSVGQRLAAIYATTLGDAKPQPAGHWLKTLSVPGDLRVWWADTDAFEEYEDAILAEVAARNPDRAIDGRGPLPFANLVHADGTPRAHGLTDSLLAAAPAAAAAAKKGASKRSATTRSRSTGSAGTRPRKTAASTRAAATAKPAPEPTFLSRDGLERMTAELDELRNVTRPQVIARVKAARELGDLRENADYEYARKEQSFVEGRIQTLEHMLRTGVVIERDEAADSVHLGSTVEVETDGERATYLIVGSREADPRSGRLSNVSPVGRALVGARAGDQVSIEVPGGSISYRVIEVR
jgi:transcription elongation factor GreA